MGKVIMFIKINGLQEHISSLSDHDVVELVTKLRIDIECLGQRYGCIVENFIEDKFFLSGANASDAFEFAKELQSGNIALLEGLNASIGLHYG